MPILTPSPHCCSLDANVQKQLEGPIGAVPA